MGSGFEYGDIHLRTAKDSCAMCGRPFETHQAGIALSGDGWLAYNGSPPVHLTEKESELLRRLLPAFGECVHKESIYASLWPDAATDFKIVYVYVCKLRRKLRGTGLEITTTWGVGLTLQATEGHP